MELTNSMANGTRRFNAAIPRNTWNNNFVTGYQVLEISLGINYKYTKMKYKSKTHNYFHECLYEFIIVYKYKSKYTCGT